MKAKTFLIISVLLIVSSSNLFGQSAKYQATYIYNFLSHIQWPKEYKSGDIIIGVLGTKDPVVNELQVITSEKRIGFRSIIIKPYSHLGEVAKCHVLFIPSRYTAQLPLAVKKISSKSTLLISSTAQGINTGADINFIVVNNKLGFELNATNTTKKKIAISSSLKRLAAKVY
ncbi:MAG: YfiR family protein [Bacteroidota bacterium]